MKIGKPYMQETINKATFKPVIKVYINTDRGTPQQLTQFDGHTQEAKKQAQEFIDNYKG